MMLSCTIYKEVRVSAYMTPPNDILSTEYLDSTYKGNDIHGQNLT